MSFLARISARARGSISSNQPAIRPKGLAAGQPTAIARETDEPAAEDEAVSPMRDHRLIPARRQAEESENASRMAADEETEMQRTAEHEEGEPEAQRQEEQSEEEVATLRRQAEPVDEEEVAPLRRAQEQSENEEAPAAPLRRQAAGDEEETEEEVAALRCQPQEEPEDAGINPMRLISRQEEVPVDETGQTAMPRPQAGLTPDAEPPLEEFAAEPEPHSMQALRRDAAPAAMQSVQRPSDAPTPIPVVTDQAASMPSHFQGLHPDPAFPHAGAITASSDASQPNVVIEQVDVMIHEPAPAYRPAGPDRGRAMRARYLRRL